MATPRRSHCIYYNDMARLTLLLRPLLMTYMQAELQPATCLLMLKRLKCREFVANQMESSSLVLIPLIPDSWYRKLELGFSSLSEWSWYRYLLLPFVTQWHYVEWRCASNRSFGYTSLWCGLDRESAEHFLLHCTKHQEARNQLKDTVSIMDLENSNKQLSLSHYLLLSPANYVTRRQDRHIKQALFQFISYTRRKLWSVVAQLYSSIQLSSLHWCRYNVESTWEYYLKTLSVFYCDVTRRVLVVLEINNKNRKGETWVAGNSALVVGGIDALAGNCAINRWSCLCDWF